MLCFPKNSLNTTPLASNCTQTRIQNHVGNCTQNHTHNPTQNCTCRQTLALVFMFKFVQCHAGSCGLPDQGPRSPCGHARDREDGDQGAEGESSVRHMLQIGGTHAKSTLLLHGGGCELLLNQL
jgi:hypothetical protein